MNFVKQLVVIILISFLLQQFLPWWAIAIGSGIGGFWLGNKGLTSFAAGFIGIALLWLGLALFIDISTDAILTQKVAKVLPLNPFLLTGIIGGLVGGFSSLSGVLLKDLFGLKNYNR